MSSGFKLICMSDELINADYLNTLNDKDYMRFSRQSKISHDYETLKSYIHFMSNAKDKRLFAFMNEGGIFAGTCTINLNKQSQVANLGFLIFKNYAGRRYASKMLKLLVEEASCLTDIKFIEIGTHVRNKKMLAIAEKAKMTQIELKTTNFDSSQMVIFRDSIQEVIQNVIDW